MSGVIVFVMGFVIVVLLCLLSWQMSLRREAQELAENHWVMAEAIRQELEDTNKRLDSKIATIKELLHKHDDYERMAAEIKSAIARHKPITDDEIPF